MGALFNPANLGRVLKRLVRQGDSLERDPESRRGGVSGIRGLFEHGMGIRMWEMSG